MCIAAANYIIKKTNQYNEKRSIDEQIVMSCKRLNKILYFSDVEYMIKHNGQSMYSDVFFAWDSGPVIPSVYYEFRPYQWGKMWPISEKGHNHLTFDMKRAIRNVLSKTNNISTSSLIKKSHEIGSPWYNAYDENDQYHLQAISKKEMYKFYSCNEWSNFSK